jgi:hypothetical protein
MTDARLPDQWLGNPRFDEWEPETWKFFIDCLMWSNRFGTDGRIPRNHALRMSMGLDLDLIEKQLIDANVCVSNGRVIEFHWEALGQSWAADVEARKQKNREKQRVSRARRSDVSLANHVSSPATSAVVRQEGPAEDDTF